jgi:hypothetical protein
MSADLARGPGGLVLHEAGLDPSRLDLSGGPAEWTRLPAMGLRDFVDETLRTDDAARVCLFLDAPRRTTTRAAAALACARSLMTADRSVVIVDGDDQRPDLSVWSGRSETEGWVDVVRYGLSIEAASVPLPWGPQAGRVMGVGSYHPVRAEKDEAAELVRRLLDDYDIVLVCASAGDRGSFWAGLDAVRVMCWDRAAATPDETAALVRDANDMGAAVNATIAFGVASVGPDDAHTAVDPSVDESASHRSSPIFRRLAISMTVLVIVLGSWFLGQLARQDETPVVLSEQSEELPVAAAVDTAITEEAPPDTVIVAGDVFEEQAYTKLEDVDDAPIVDDEPEPIVGVDWSTPVKEGVYCLHVFSMADSVMAQDQLRWMDRRGVTGLVRRWRDVDEKIWYRIYTGSFATLAAARAAVPEIYEQLDTDWALPKRTARIR